MRIRDWSSDVCSSDLAPTTGHGATDHLRIMALAETAHAFAVEVLAPGGGFVAKLFQGGAERALLTALKRDFAEVKHVKPQASRSRSEEHTSELQSLMRISYAVFCLKKNTIIDTQ